MLRRSISPATIVLAAVIAAAFPCPARAAEAAPSSPAPGVTVSIRFFDKRVYYPESEIPLKITITNGSAATYRFKLAEDRAYSLSFEVRTLSNRALDSSDELKRLLSSTRPVFYREVAVEPGEEYSFVERLERFVRIDDAGSFSIRATFWPELAQTGSPLTARPGTEGRGLGLPLSSNVLLLSVRPSPGIPPASEAIRPETGEILKPQSLPPDEVVRRTIVARQRSRWNEFFLYLDLEALLSRNEDRKRMYDRESDEGRRRMLEKYRNDLRESVVDGDIVVIPASFDIIETRYAGNSGNVRVLSKFDYREFRMLKEYVFELKRRDDIWYITGYSVTNKGTE